MKNKIIIIYLFLLILFNGCSGLKRGLGVEKDKPNEFLIEKREPLVLPPDYKILPPGSKVANKETKKTNSLKSVLDQSLNDKKEVPNSTNKPSSDLEQEILKKIK